MLSLYSCYQAFKQMTDSKFKLAYVVDSVSTTGSQVIIFKTIVFLSLKIDFVLANNVDTDELTHCVAFHLGLHSLP